MAGAYRGKPLCTPHTCTVCFPHTVHLVTTIHTGQPLRIDKQLSQESMFLKVCFLQPGILLESLCCLLGSWKKVLPNTFQLHLNTGPKESNAGEQTQKVIPRALQASGKRAFLDSFSTDTVICWHRG